MGKFQNFLSKGSSLLDKVQNGLNKNQSTNPTDTPFENFVNTNLDGIELPATPVKFPKWLMFVGVGFLLLFAMKMFKKKQTFRKRKTTKTNYKYNTRVNSKSYRKPPKYGSRRKMTRNSRRKIRRR